MFLKYSYLSPLLVSSFSMRYSHRRYRDILKFCCLHSLVFRALFDLRHLYFEVYFYFWKGLDRRFEILQIFKILLVFFIFEKDVFDSLIVYYCLFPLLGKLQQVLEFFLLIFLWILYSNSSQYFCFLILFHFRYDWRFLWKAHLFN